MVRQYSWWIVPLASGVLEPEVLKPLIDEMTDNRSGAIFVADRFLSITSQSNKAMPV
jgi:hypothetical protein